MRLIYLNQKNLDEVTKVATATLRRGDVIIYPTDTCYGLGARMTARRALEKIVGIKHRRAEKAFLSLVSGLSMVKRFASVTAAHRRLAKKFWPGSLTMIFNHRARGLSPQVCLDGSIAFRASKNQFLRKLIRALGEPLISTSLNVSGQPNIYRQSEVLAFARRAWPVPDLIILAGDLPRRPTSTLVDPRVGKIKVLRQGKIKV